MKNKENILIILFIVIVVGVFAWPYLAVHVKYYGEKEIILDYGEEYSEPGFKAKLLSTNVTNKLKITNNITDNLGEYEVSYIYKPKFSLIDVYTKRKVIVKDLSAPELNLTGGDEIEVTINTNFIEPGYSAIDNYDGDVTENVEVTGSIDINTLGDYELTYTVSDSHNNKTEKVRKVHVTKLKPTQMSLTEYTLEGWYEEAQAKDTGYLGEEYYNTIKIVGDSNIMNMHRMGFIKTGNAWAVPCLHAESMFSTNVNVYGTEEQILVLDAVKKYKPDRIIINFGSFSTAWITPEIFEKNANEMINQIKEISPNTKIALMSILPIDKSLEGIKFEQDTINKYNFKILEIAYKQNVTFLDVSSVLKGTDGYVNKGYIQDDGYYLDYYGFVPLKNYIITHGF